jgi:hypothetical protein
MVYVNVSLLSACCWSDWDKSRTFHSKYPLSRPKLQFGSQLIEAPLLFQVKRNCLSLVQAFLKMNYTQIVKLLWSSATSFCTSVSELTTGTLKLVQCKEQKWNNSYLSEFKIIDIIHVVRIKMCTFQELYANYRYHCHEASSVLGPTWIAYFGFLPVTKVANNAI